MPFNFPVYEKCKNLNHHRYQYEKFNLEIYDVCSMGVLASEIVLTTSLVYNV